MANKSRNSGSASGAHESMAAAIIGLACLFPGSENLAAYWRAIHQGLDAIGDIPADHWAVEDYYDPDPKAEDKTYGRRGGFLSPVAFEPMKYGIVPNDISAIDATQLLGLMAADQALNDAGYGPDSGCDHRRTAVLLGVTGALKMVVSLGSRLAHPQLRRALADSGVDADTAAEVLKRFASEFTPWQESSFPGLLGNVTAGRIANRLNLGGANMVVDAACASSLAAVRQGLMELESGQADLVVTGGLDTFSDPFMYTCFSKTPALSPRGDVRPYDLNGDGTVLGEGIGVIILKRLEEARRDGDRIYAVIRSVGCSSDGKGTAIFAPSAEGQRRALINAYGGAGIDPGSVGLVEGHGTGTAVGDAVEVDALNQVFKQSSKAGKGQPWCSLGSVKAQIGHTKAAAGAAGLIKAAMALHMKSLPPSVKVKVPLPILTEPGSPFYLSTRPRPWISPGPRRAAVSAFGFGGSNFHCLLEENEDASPRPSLPEDLIFMAFSDDNPEALAGRLQRAALGRNLQAEAWESRRSFSHARSLRLALVTTVDNFPPLAEECLRLLGRKEIRPETFPDGAFYEAAAPYAGQYGFLLPGPGSVRADMFRELAGDWPEVLEALSEAAGALAEEAPELAALDLALYPPDLASPEMLRIWKKDLADPRLRLAVSKGFGRGLVKLLERFNLRPAEVVGVEDQPLNLVQELNRKSRQSVGLWLEVGCGCELSLAVLSAFDKRHKVLALDGGGEGHLDLTSFLARLAVWGLPLDLSAWPSSQPFEERRSQEGSGTFAMNISGANQFVKKSLPPSPPKAAAPGGSAINLPEALERMTAETAALHQKFLDQQSEALRLLGLSLGEESGARPAPVAPTAPAAAPVVVAAEPQAAAPAGAALNAGAVMAVVSRETGYPAEMLLPEMNLETDLGLDSIKKVEIMAALSEQYPGVRELGAEHMSRASTLADLIDLMTAPAEAAPEAGEPAGPRPGAGAPAASGALWPVLLEVVSAETGYPREMLGPEMRLSDDLGLDSIKMVEIASLMSEKLPSAAVLTAEALASAVTLGELASALEKEAAGAPAAAVPPASPAGAAVAAGKGAPLVAGGSSAGGRAADEIILEVLSQETGYPRDMLKMEMDLEADLGLDSIKKVEIMAAVSERLPEVEALADGERLAGLQTLADLAALATGHSPATGASPTAGPSPATGPSPAAGADQVTDLLLEVVAAETGYPREMLNLNAALEADLGLDSIKRVEIMAALSEKMGGAEPAGPPAEFLAQAVTLGDLAELLRQPSPAENLVAPPPAPEPKPAPAGTPEPGVKKRGPGRPPKNSPPAFKVEPKSDPAAAAETGSTTGLSSFQVEMSALNLPDSPWPLKAGTRLVLLADESPLASALAARLGEVGAVERLGWAESQRLESLVSYAGLVMVWPGDCNDLSLPAKAFQALRAAAPVLVKAAREGTGGLLMGLSFMGGAFGEGQQAPTVPASAALGGLLKTAAREWPEVRVRSLDLPLKAFGPEGAAYSEAVMRAAGDQAPVEVGLSAPGLFKTPVLRPYKLKNIRVRHIREGQTLLVTGGARGVTAAAVKELARAFKPHLVIMGRTPLPGEEEEPWLANLRDEASIRQALFERAEVRPGPRELARESARIMAGREVRSNLAAMEKAGAKVTYLSGDFQDPAALRAAVGEVKRLYGPVCGFIHGAGVLADGLIADKSEADFNLVFDTKVKMADLILAELKGQPLNLVAFFSSSTARFGRRGQADYAAANEILNKLARSLADGRQGPKCLSVNWGPWAGGMVDAALARLFEEEGIGLIPLPEGARLFSALAGAPKNDPVEVVVLGPMTDLSAI